jgi:hypothetical protein
MWHDYNSNVLVYACFPTSPLLQTVTFDSVSFLFLCIKYACHLIRAQKSFFIVSFMDILQLFSAAAVLLHVNAMFVIYFHDPLLFSAL